MELILVLRRSPEIGHHCSRHGGEVNAGWRASAGREDSMRGPSITVDLITSTASDSGRLAHTFSSPAEATNKHHILLLSLRGNPRGRGDARFLKGARSYLEVPRTERARNRLQCLHG